MRVEVPMAAYDTAARKRPVNLTLNEDLVAQARAVTDNSVPSPMSTPRSDGAVRRSPH
jgi:hypothetical protein